MLDPDVRWVGNERGVAGDPLWNTLNKADFAPGRADEARLNRGDRPGSHWVPAECDVSIRPGWFYHSSEDSKVKSAATLVDLYYAPSVAAVLSCLTSRRIVADRFPNPDVNSLREFRRILDATFREDLAQGAHVSASNTRRRSTVLTAKRHRRKTRYVLDHR
jgi:alpha-L-fucosidase